MKRIIAAALLTLSTAAMASPTSMKIVDQGEMADGRKFVKMEITCSNASEAREIFKFDDSRKWCLADESYCGQKIKAAKKACKAK